MTKIVSTSNRRSSSPKNHVYIVVIAILAIAVIALQLDKTTKNTTNEEAEQVNLNTANANVDSSKAPMTNANSNEEKNGDVNAISTVAEGDVAGVQKVAEEDIAEASTNATPQKKAIKGVAAPLVSHFDNPVENMLHSLTVRGKHFKSIPRNNMTDEQILEYLRKPVEIYEDDDEKTIAAKEATADMKTQALAFIEGGGTYDDFVRQMVQASNEEHDLLDDVRITKMKILKEQGLEACAEYLEEANKVLAEAGLKPFKLTVFDTNIAERAMLQRAN